MISERSSEEPENSYLLLMAKVGNNGRYQWVIYILLIAYWICYGININSISLLYLDVQFDCTSFNIP